MKEKIKFVEKYVYTRKGTRTLKTLIIVYAKYM